MFLQSLEDSSFILEINLVLTVLFTTLAVILLGTVLFMRVRKNKKAERKETLKTLIIDFINHFLFEEDFNKTESLVTFKNKHLKSTYDNHIAINQLLMFNENLKGESFLLIKELFYGLGLYRFLVKDLESRGWHKKTRAIYILNKLNIKASEKLVVAQLNAKREEIRHQAIMYLINTSGGEDPLSFLDKIDRPLTPMAANRDGARNAHL